jgi:hypothetical protein
MEGNIQRVFQPLNNELTWINAKWQIYLQFYGTKKEDLDLINRMSPTLFRIIQDTLVDDLILSISRLTDPPFTKLGKKTRENLTFSRLFQEIDSKKHPHLLTKLQTLLDRLQLSCESMREQRNKRIAHTDLDTKLNANLLPAVTRSMLEEALKLCSDIMNAISIEFRDTQIAFDHVVLNDDGNTLLLHLQMAEAYGKHIDSGHVDPWNDGVFRTP